MYTWPIRYKNGPWDTPEGHAIPELKVNVLADRSQKRDGTPEP